VADDAVRDAVAKLSARASDQATNTAALIRTEAVTAAVGLGVLGATALVLGVWVSRAVRRELLDRLTSIDAAAAAIRDGDAMRRFDVGRDDELTRVAEAINAVLDRRDRDEAAMRGRNRELRALLAALVREVGAAAAVTGIDGEVLASALSQDQERVVEDLTPLVRNAARNLLRRGFVSPTELVTDLEQGGHHVAIRALVLGDRRIVGWLLVFDRRRSTTPRATASGADA
jgi:hypothetical protein